MRLLFIIITLFIFTTGYSQLSAINGTVIDTATKMPLSGAKVTLLLKKGNQNTAVAVDTTDTYGDYHFKNITAGQYKLLCFYKIKHPYLDSSSEIAEYFGHHAVDSNIIISPPQAYTHNFYLPVTCVYNQTKDQAFCPVCKKTDMVKPILWGLPVLNPDGKYVVDGKEEDLHKYYMGGCSPPVLCTPTKHCNRCDADF